MDPIQLIQRSGNTDLTPEEEAALARELAAAYHVDEKAAISRDVHRIAEKVRARLAQADTKSPSHRNNPK